MGVERHDGDSRRAVAGRTGSSDDFLHPERFPDWPRSLPRAAAVSRVPARAAVGSAAATPTPISATSCSRSATHPRPVLVIWGKQDPNVPFEFSASLMARDAVRAPARGRSGRTSAAVGAARHRPSGDHLVSPRGAAVTRRQRSRLIAASGSGVAGSSSRSGVGQPDVGTSGAAGRVWLRIRNSGHSMTRSVRAERQFPIRQPGVERDQVSVGDSRSCMRRVQTGRRVSRRRTRTELHLHRRAQVRRSRSSSTSAAATSICT